ncbi:MAG: hypothetical protein II649_11475 [Kiritimatiellae bacterium]|nr:hypothetical protein [Kiritimatiellia bacterium]
MDYKKILAATAAVIGTVAMADGIVSSSVVGYMTVQRPAGYQNSFGGSFFMNCGSDSYTLADIQISGPASKANGRNNYIAFMSSSGMKLDKVRSYWWDPVGLKWRVRSGTNFNNDPDVEDATQVKIGAGEGFMCSFAQATTTITMPTSL